MLGLLLHVIQLFLYREVKGAPVVVKGEVEETKEFGANRSAAKADTCSSPVGDPVAAVSVS